VTVERARDELFAAHLLVNTGFATAGVAVAVRAALGAAEDALVALDRTPPADAAGTAAAFVRHVVRARGFDPDAGRLLRSLVGRAELAALGPVPPDEGVAALADASTVVDAVDAWLTHSEFVAIARDAGVPTRPKPVRRRR
jgi:hypothetical protein